MICSKCRALVREDARFCQRCGTPIKTRELAPAGAVRAHADLQTQKMPSMQIGPYRVVRLLRPDDNIYVVESDEKTTGGASKMRIAIESPRSLPKRLFEQAGELARLENIVKLWNQVRDERGVPFVIVGFVPGDPLDRVPTPLAPNRALTVGLQLATIIDYVHQHNLTFNLMSPRGAQTDSLTRFQKAFLLDERDRLCFFDHSLLMPLPRTGKARFQDEDVLRILRIFLRLLKGTTVGQIIGVLKQDTQQLANVTGRLVKDPPTSARDLAGALTQMLPPLPSPSTTVKLADRAPKPPAPATPQLMSFAQTDVGKQRDHNEDNYLALPMEAMSGLFVVADGMGGQAAGEVASQLAVDEMRQSATREWTQLTPASTSDHLRGLLHTWIQRANSKIVAQAREQSNNMGSTLTAALIWNRQIYTANVGDSRTYLLRGGELYPLTWDHSLVASLVRAGLLEPEAVYDHPQRNEIFRSLGQSGEVKVDVFEPIELGAGDQVLLCSDGLWEMVRLPQLKDILTRGSDPAACCAELIRAANDKGGDDNITVVLIRIT